MDALHRVAQKLLEKEVIDAKEFEELWNGEEPSVLDDIPVSVTE